MVNALRKIAVFRAYGISFQENAREAAAYLGENTPNQKADCARLALMAQMARTAFRILIVKYRTTASVRVWDYGCCGQRRIGLY